MTGGGMTDIQSNLSSTDNNLNPKNLTNNTTSSNRDRKVKFSLVNTN